MFQQHAEQDKECRQKGSPHPPPVHNESGEEKKNVKYTYDSQERTLRLPMGTRLAFDRSHSSSRDYTKGRCRYSFA